MNEKQITQAALTYLKEHKTLLYEHYLDNHLPLKQKMAFFTFVLDLKLSYLQTAEENMVKLLKHEYNYENISSEMFHKIIPPLNEGV